MGRTKLRGIELGGVQVAVEVTDDYTWSWPRLLAQRSCAPTAPDLHLGVRVASDPPELADGFLGYHAGGVTEVGTFAGDTVIRVRGAASDSPVQRWARFDPSLRFGEIVVTPELASQGACPLGSPLDELIVLLHATRNDALAVWGSLSVDSGRALVFLGDDHPAASRDVSAAGAGWIVLRPEHGTVRTHPLDPAHARARGAELHGLHVTHSLLHEGGGPQALDADSGAGELLRYAFETLHDPASAERVQRVARIIAGRAPLLSLGASPSRRFAWHKSRAGTSLLPAAID